MFTSVLLFNKYVVLEYYLIWDSFFPWFNKGGKNDFYFLLVYPTPPEVALDEIIPNIPLEWVVLYV